jgi:hypothetical protein
MVFPRLQDMLVINATTAQGLLDEVAATLYRWVGGMGSHCCWPGGNIKTVHLAAFMSTRSPD